MKPQDGTSGKILPEVARATELVGKIYGESRTQVEKRLAIAKAAEAEPEQFGNLLEDMDRSGRVNAPYRRLKVARQAEAIRAEPPPLPGRGPYYMLSGDPPWPYELRQEDPSTGAFIRIRRCRSRRFAPWGRRFSASPPRTAFCGYGPPTITCARRFRSSDTWGFEQKTILTWVKDRMGLGDWLRNQTEHVLMATRGSPVVQLTNQTTVFYGEARAHSQKPEEFYAFVEKLCPAPRYCELFSRHTRPNWDGHGDELGPGLAAE